MVIVVVVVVFAFNLKQSEIVGYFLRVIHSCPVLAFFGVFSWVSRDQDMINACILEEVPCFSNLLVDHI